MSICLWNKQKKSNIISALKHISECFFSSIGALAFIGCCRSLLSNQRRLLDRWFSTFNCSHLLRASLQTPSAPHSLPTDRFLLCTAFLCLSVRGTLQMLLRVRNSKWDTLMQHTHTQTHTRKTPWKGSTNVPICKMLQPATRIHIYGGTKRLGSARWRRTKSFHP